MENYICVEKVEAEAATNHDFATWANGGTLPDEYATVPLQTGFKVVEAGGKAYWMSDADFNAKFTKSGEMTFGEAIAAMQAGKKVTRAGWNNNDIYLEIEGSSAEMTEPYIFMTKNTGATKFPMVPSMESVLAGDWVELE